MFFFRLLLVIDMLMRIVIINNKMNVWCLLGFLIFLLLIDKDKKLFIFFFFICWRYLKVLFILILVRLFLFFVIRFWIFIIVVEMYWYFLKEGCFKKCRIFDIVVLSCFFDILNLFVWVKLIFCILWNVFKCFMFLLIKKYL